MWLELSDKMGIAKKGVFKWFQDLDRFLEHSHFLLETPVSAHFICFKSQSEPAK
jgi:hypothetical protein